MSSTLESYELIRFAEAFEARLATAEEMIIGRPGLEAEKQWLAAALERLREAREPSAGLLGQVKDLPELDEAREEFSFDQQGKWVDALEKLHAGITFTASSRAPVIEALFPHLKFPQLRRAPADLVNEYATSYERRYKSAYVTRIFSRDDFAMVRPVVEMVASTFGAWTASLTPTPLPPDDEAALRESLVALGRRLDVALRQGRLLAEAALVPAPGVFEAAGLTLKPRKRAGRSLALSSEEGGLDPFGEEEPGQEEAFEGASESEEEVSADDGVAETTQVDPPPLEDAAHDTEVVEPASSGRKGRRGAPVEPEVIAADPTLVEAPAAGAEAVRPRRGRPPKVRPLEAAPVEAASEGAPEAVAPRRRKKADPSEAGTP